MNCLAYRARAICSEDTLKDELQNIQGILKENGYPDQFVKRHMELKQNKPQKLDVPKKQLFLSVPFKGDKSLEILRQRLNNVVSSTFPAARLCLLPRTQTLICQRTKDKLPQISTNMCLYNFTCSCGAVYLGKTTRRLSKRISEHCPASLRKGTVKNINSAILGHLVDTNHQIDVKGAFKVYYHLPSKYSKGVRKRLLSTAEAIAIRIINPDLCKQKKFIQTLLLPWPS